MHRSNMIALGVSLALATAAAQAGSHTGPQSSATPYVVPTADGWEVTSLITVGDTAKNSPYAMVGIPDGMGAVAGKFAENGAYVADKAYITVFLNHELGGSAGVVRAHGSTGAFVSQWTIHLNSLQVKWGEDLIRDVYVWDGSGFAQAPGVTFNRFCSGDLPPLTGFYDSASGKGFNGLIYMNGEETGAEGRAFGHVVSGDEKGTSYELPYLGKFSWENSVAHPNAGDKTLVVGLDDSSPGQVYLYVGDKQSSGNPVERAGLQNGYLYGIKVTDGGSNYGNGPAPSENAGAIEGSFELHPFTRAEAAGSGAALQALSVAAGVTEFARPEDGHWDTRNPNVFYWATTGRSNQTARLYKFTFDSIENPAGGTIELVVDSASLTGEDGETARSFDNLTVDGDGNVIVQEDPGGSAYIAKTWKINPTTGSAVQIFESDRDRFDPAGPDFLTTNEESSGVIEVTDIVQNANWYEAGRRYYLANMQAHYPIAGELVEGGQVYLMASPNMSAAPARSNKKGK
jgi:secreted PhoX family phosphatase